MSRVKNRDTDLECRIRGLLHRRGLRFRKHVRTLPGSPDIVFTSAMVAVFIDGDFWHGFRFPLWEHTVPQFWQTKISLNRQRDRRNFRRLRRMGWKVVRLWQHEVNRDSAECVRRIQVLVKRGSPTHRSNNLRMRLR